MNIRQAKDYIKNSVNLYLKKDELGAYRVPVVRQRPIFLLGAPGIGKTAIMEQIAQEMGIALMLAGNMGMGAYNKLSAHGITVIRGCHGKVDDVLKAYQNGELQDSLESCDHHDCTHHEEKPVYVI